ncbi:predicted protein [Aspergillus terreus NIH2624]|uniref:Thiamine-binding protein domain-containing protein n=1 Tax=Aspergillus terreus (strain NIH 2624 / FGSC A1156) TaxID=341663 RepID=Q0CZY0_ASPTN|nr:uncharacterized protein ATEG_00754 [Aspergillus terreus NIH2624]EAU39400.1 predicted protein [Aspergillus terreus NIH2624]
MASADLDAIPTPAHCTADFCLIPIGTSSPSVSAQIADVQRLIEKSGLKYVMHSAGTTLGTSVCSSRLPAFSLLAARRARRTNSCAAVSWSSSWRKAKEGMV